MMGMASELYYEGIIKYGTRPPDFEALAAAVNYLRANDVMIEVGRAHVKGDDVLFPFVVKEPPSLFSDGTQKKSVSLLKQVLEECSVSYRKVVPSTKRTELLRVCTRLSGGKNAEVLADASDFKRVELPSSSSDPFAHLVGMHEQKKQLRDIADTVAAYGREVLSSCHLSFTGDPGTGKTELARSMLAYFDALGVTSGKGVFVKADAADLIGRYVGNTPHLVREAVLRAKGGILFIDEAYRLASGDGGREFVWSRGGEHARGDDGESPRRVRVRACRLRA